MEGASSIIMLVVLFAVFYFMLIRPENKRKKQAQAMRDSLKKGDTITTIGGITGIVFQFPLYGGVLGMVRYSGLVDIVAGGLASISTPFTFPLITFLTAAFINMFVPSGGGQWAVQGPIAIASAKAMGADLLKLPVCGVWQHLDQSGPALLGNRHTGHLRSKGKGYYGLYDCNYAVEWPNLYAWRHIPTGIE